MSDIRAVHEGKDGWYFWDESWSDAYGPYPDKSVAQAALKSYSAWLDGGGYLPNVPLSTKKQRREFINERRNIKG